MDFGLLFLGKGGRFGFTERDIENIKPILYDLSCLTKEELRKAGFDDHIDFLTHEREHWIKVYGFEKYISKLPYGHFQYLVENHFNVFNLDESEYINKETLNHKS